MTNTKAQWNISLDCDCPACQVPFDVLEQDEDFYAQGRQVGEHDTKRSTNYQTVCPNCQHEFTVDFEL